MLLIPAIDIKNGNCVRLSQGRMDTEHIYSDQPIAMAERWINAGARRLHVVDLDGALAGKPVNIEIIHDIATSFPHIPIQVGGGIRNEETIENYLNAGVSYVIIGTQAVTTPHFVSDMCIEFPTHIIVALDIKNGKLAINGWSKLSNHDAIEMGKRFENDGVTSIIFTDINRDGMMNRVNTEATVELCTNINTPVIASGGITDLDDIRTLCEVADEGIEAAITGKAIYEGSLDFAKAQQLADQLCSEKST